MSTLMAASTASTSVLSRCNSYPACNAQCLRSHRQMPPRVSAAAAVGSTSCRRCAFAPAQAMAPASIARSRRSAVRVNANWGAPVEFKAAKVLSNTPATAAGGLHKLVVEVGPLAAGYTIPGQFMQIKVGDSKPGFFAISSAPGAAGADRLEFLIKSAPGSTAELLCNAAAGAEIAVSPVMGKGFPMDRLPASTTTSVLLFATGSGISPIRALIESGALDGRKATLYYGTRSADFTAFKELLPAWQQRGVSVVNVYSETRNGYVHDVFEREGVARLPADAASSVGAVLCGQKPMCQAVTNLLTSKGVPADKILLNF